MTNTGIQSADMAADIWWTPVTTLFRKKGTLSLSAENLLNLTIKGKQEFSVPLATVQKANFAYGGYVFLTVNDKLYKLAFYDPFRPALVGLLASKTLVEGVAISESWKARFASAGKVSDASAAKRVGPMSKREWTIFFGIVVAAIVVVVIMAILLPAKNS